MEQIISKARNRSLKLTWTFLKIKNGMIFAAISNNLQRTGSFLMYHKAYKSSVKKVRHKTKFLKRYRSLHLIIYIMS